VVSDVVVVTMANEDAAHLIILVVKARETVMDPQMVDNMMVIGDVKEILCVEATIVKSSGLIIMRRTTAVKVLLYIMIIQGEVNVQIAVIQDLSLRNLHMVSVVVVVIMANEDAAHLKTLVVKVREIVMDLMMVAYMMVMTDVEETLCVEATTVKSLDLTITRRTTAVKNLPSIIIIQVESYTHPMRRQPKPGRRGAIGAGVQGLVAAEK